MDLLVDDLDGEEQFLRLMLMVMYLLNDRLIVQRRRHNYPVQAYPMFALNGYDAQVFHSHFRMPRRAFGASFIG